MSTRYAFDNTMLTFPVNMFDVAPTWAINNLDVSDGLVVERRDRAEQTEKLFVPVAEV